MMAESQVFSEIFDEIAVEAMGQIHQPDLFTPYNDSLSDPSTSQSQELDEFDDDGNDLMANLSMPVSNPEIKISDDRLANISMSPLESDSIIKCEMRNDVGDNFFKDDEGDILLAHMEMPKPTSTVGLERRPNLSSCRIHQQAPPSLHPLSFSNRLECLAIRNELCLQALKKYVYVCPGCQREYPGFLQIRAYCPYCDLMEQDEMVVDGNEDNDSDHDSFLSSGLPSQLVSPQSTSSTDKVFHTSERSLSESNNSDWKRISNG